MSPRTNAKEQKHGGRYRGQQHAARVAAARALHHHDREQREQDRRDERELSADEGALARKRRAVSRRKAVAELKGERHPLMPRVPDDDRQEDEYGDDRGDVWTGRSEERRVGKEGRRGGGREDHKTRQDRPMR